MESEHTDRVLVIGAGVAGMRAALDLSRNGVKSVLVEREPVLGGVMAARLCDVEESFGFARGGEIPRPGDITKDANIEVLTLAEVVGFEGSPGAFTATIRQHPRFVTDACTRCNRCHSVCPSVAPNSYHSGLAYRKAIYTPFRDAAPATYVIDIETCLNSPPNYLPCQRCVEACEDNAIHFELDQEQTIVRHIDAVILATGFSLAGPATLNKNGYGTHPDVLTYMELERLLTSSGPTGGFVEKPSNGATPSSVLFVTDDVSHFSIGCVASQCAKLSEQEITNVSILHSTLTSAGDRFAEFWLRVAKSPVTLIEGTFEKVAAHDEDVLHVRYSPQGAHASIAHDFDLVVFTTVAQPAPGMADLAGVLGIERDTDGFVRPGPKSEGMNATTRPGVYVSGCAGGLDEIANCIAESKAVAIYAMRHVANQQKALSAPEIGPSGFMVDGRWLTSKEIHERLTGLLLQLIDPRMAT